MPDVDVLVVGGGISGLATAHCLARSGVRVEVWERDARPGGKICSRARDGYLLERAASMILNFRPEVDRFLIDTGVYAHKSPRSPVSNRYLLDHGQLRPVPTHLGKIVGSPLWSTRAKIRLLAEPFARRTRDEHETAARFITRRLGPEVLENGIEPYIAGPLGSDADLAEARSVLPRLTALERRYGSLAIGALIHKAVHHRTAVSSEVFSFRGGMSRLVEQLADSASITLRKDLSATAIEPHRNGWKVCGETSGSYVERHARQVVLSTPADAAASLTGALDRELGRLLRTIDYAPIAIVHTGFDRASVSHALDGTGFLVPRRAGLALTGCLWMSRLFAQHAPSEHVLLSTYLGGARNRASASWNSERSLDAVMSTLCPLLGIRGEPSMVHIDRHGNGLPLYHGAYSKLLQAIDQRLARLPGLHLEANYRGGVSVRDRILCANIAAARIKQRLGTADPYRSDIQRPAMATALGIDS